VIHVNLLRTAEVDPVYFPQIEVVGDIANAIWQIKEGLVPQPHWDFDRLLRLPRGRWRTLGELADDARFPIFPQHLVAEVREVHAGRRHHLPRQRHLQDLVRAQLPRLRMPNTVLLDNALATMGAGLPSAMASRAWSSRAQGDGDLRRRRLHDEQPGAGDRGAPGLDLTVLILRDDAYGMIRWKQADMGFADFGWTSATRTSSPTPRATAQRPPRREREHLRRAARHVPRRAAAST
jgi:acetolactate synthase I/II/III large subunit